MGIVLTEEQLQLIIDNAVAQANVAAQNGVAAGIQAAQAQAQAEEVLRAEGALDREDLVSIIATTKSMLNVINSWFVFTNEREHRPVNLAKMPELVSINEALGMVVLAMTSMLNTLDPQPPAPIAPPEVIL